MKLVETVDAVLAGSLSLDEAERRIQAAAGDYELETVMSLDTFATQADPRMRLARDIRELFRRMDAAGSATTVATIGRLAVAASTVLGNVQAGAAWTALGLALVNHREPDHARDALAHACTHLDAAFAADDLDRHDWITYVRALGAYAILLGPREQERAKAIMDRALSVARRMGNPVLLAIALPDGAELFASLGLIDEALAFLREAAEIRSVMSDDESERHRLLTSADFQFRIGRVARGAGRTEDAVRAFETALESVTGSDTEYQRAIVMSELGELWYAMDAERGRAWMEQAARLAEGAGHPQDADRWRRHVGVSRRPPVLEPADLSSHEFLSRGQGALRANPPNLQAAYALFLVAIKQAGKEQREDYLGEGRVLLGMTLAGLLRHDEAAANLRAGVRIFESRGDRQKVLASRILLTEILIRTGERDEAETLIRKAIQEGEELRESATTGEFREAAAASLATAYGLLAYFLMRPWVAQDAARSDELVVVGQRARASNLMARIDLERAAAAAGDEALARAARTLRQLEVRLQVAADRRTATAALVDQHHQARSVLQSLSNAGPGRADIGAGVPPLSASDLASALKKGEGLLDVMTFTEGLILTLVTPDRPPRTRGVPWRREARLSFLDDWTAFVRGPAHAAGGRTKRGSVEAPTERAAPVLRTEEALLGDLKTLSDSVEALLSDHDGIERLFVVPHRELFVLPACALVPRRPNLVVSVLPTAAMLRFRGGARASARRQLAIADWSGTLPGCKAEVAALHGYTPIEPVRVERLLADLANATAFHFAGHGIFRPGNPYGSGLVLDPSNGESHVLDAVETICGVPHLVLTTARLMSDLRMDAAELVVLSGCCTGLPRAHAASEFTGLPAAFFVAGARNVVASLWPVDDGGTHLLMGCFYEELKARGPSEALMRARRQVAEMPRADVEAKLGSEYGLPDGPFPFAGIEHSFAFQHYGFD